MRSIFDEMYEPIKLKGKIRMFEAFSGVGTQLMALKRITSNYEIVGYSEIDKYAIQSYHAIHGDVKAYGDITKMVEIPPCDIFTYSFPCTDLSKAGKQKGMTKHTRSGLVYEVLRLVRETQNKPKVLIMENVPDLIQTNFVRQFGEIQLELERMGYMNYVETLNAKDFGVAQNRDRVFMVSVLDGSYEFPETMKLEKRLKDYLEDDVSEKYYLSDKQIESIINPIYESMGIDRVNEIDGVSTAVTTAFMPSIAIPEATKQGYALAHDGDGVYINRPHQKRGVVQDQMIQTIKTSGNDIGVVVGGIIDDTQGYDGVRYYNDLSPTLRSERSGLKTLTNNLRIRKLTPLECWRLMGISDEDFYKAQASGVSNSQLYKQAGNAICVPVFEAILRRMIEDE